MSGKRIFTAAVSLCFACLLGACGPRNTLPLGKGGNDSRLKAMESSLEKSQSALKDMEKRQAESDAKTAALEKQLAEVLSALHARGGKTPPDVAVPRGSALGVGFVTPGAAASPKSAPQPPEAPPSEPEASPSPQPSGTPTPPPATPPAHTAKTPPSAAFPQPPRPEGDANQGIPMPPLVKGQPGRTQAAPRTPDAKNHPSLRVGQPEPPATPEAAIAADNAAAAAATPPVAQTPSPATPRPPVAPEPPAAGQPPRVASPAPSAGKVAPPRELPPKLREGAPAGYAETATPAEKTAYNKALQLAINGNAGSAKAAFEQFLAAHPQSPLAPNALYWVGEGAYASGDYKTAIIDFEKVSKGWPGHGKAADALYKMGMAQEKEGDTAAARTSYERYLKDYPNAELAGLVRQKLEALSK